MNKTIVRFAILALFNTATLAASVPHIFTAGSPALASEVNANFAALVTAVTTLETKVAALEAKVGPHTTASLAGTYDYFEVRIDVDNLSATLNAIAGAGVSGTVVLNANGTGQANTSESYRQLTFNAVVTGDNTVQVGFNNIPATTSQAITWSFANGVVTISGGNNFVVVGQLLMQSMVNFEGQNGIAILARR